MYGPSSANSFAKRRLPLMANASNAEFEGQGHMEKPYDGRCFCDLAVVLLKSKTKTNPGSWFFRCPLWKSKKDRCSYFQWMDETHDDGIDVIECSVNSKNVEIYETCLSGRGGWNLPSTFSGEELLLMKKHIRRVEKLLILTIVLVVIGLILSSIALIR